MAKNVKQNVRGKMERSYGYSERSNDGKLSFFFPDEFVWKNENIRFIRFYSHHNILNKKWIWLYKFNSLKYIVVEKLI